MDELVRLSISLYLTKHEATYTMSRALWESMDDASRRRYVEIIASDVKQSSVGVRVNVEDQS